MSKSNLEIVQAAYAALGSGDIDGFVEAMAPDIVWNEAENNTLADGNPYTGPQAVLEGVFARLAEQYDDFGVTPDRWVADGDQVVMCGRYNGRAKATGEIIGPQIVHWWTVRGGKLAAFQQYADTLALARVLGEMK